MVGLQLGTLSALSLALLITAGVAEAKTKTIKSRASGEAASAQAPGGAHKNAMAECESQYGGRRPFLERDRYAYIEQCFKSATGMYPHQAKMNCSVKNC
jgi:hypothetical protein